MTQPNILLLVLDSARLDYAQQHAPSLQSLADDNLHFTHAIAPSTWSLPSHISIFSGKYPHEHGCFRINEQYTEELPLTKQLRTDGYVTYGISGNGFASPSKNFDVGFDDFAYTPSNIPNNKGLPVEAIGNHLQNAGHSKVEVASDLFVKCLKHDHPVTSIANFTRLTLWYLSKRYDYLEKIPLSLFEAEQEYDPSENTKEVLQIFDEQENSEEPFFLFANYMDCHWPYDPPKDLRNKHAPGLRQNEVDRLNDSVAPPWQFIELEERDKKVQRSDLEAIRDLYIGELESVDRHLERILSGLEQRGLRDDTIVVVTADHGENLGEVDDRGRRRMGHEASISDNLLRVPLVIANPAFEGEKINEWVSLKDLFSLFVEGRETLFESAGEDFSAVLPDEDLVLSEYPAVGGQGLYDKWPTIPNELLAERISEHTVIAYQNDWKVAVSSTGKEWAWKNGEQNLSDQAPKIVTETCRDSLQKLQRSDDGSAEINDEEIERLEALGYM